ncbi:MAG: class II fructose-bisphosphate aldolase [bacterium]
MYENTEKMLKAVSGAVEIEDGETIVTGEERLVGGVIDDLIRTATLHDDEKTKSAARWIIRESAQALGIYPASINDLYLARGRGEVKGDFSVPAVNIRFLTYDVARALFRAARRNNSLAFIFEIAKSEMGYTFQQPGEYAPNIIAAAIRERHRGPVFIQGDHYQLKAKNFRKDAAAEKESVKKLISDSIAAGFFNIDIDSSTLVDLDRPTIDEQQKDNYEVTAELTRFIRGIEPEGVTVSVGGEIGEVGHKNSTEEELIAYMEGLNASLPGGMTGISKVSVQTGTTHGGVPLPDGSIADVKLDFDTLERLSRLAVERYGLGGAVQHGASTLPDELFDKFPAHRCNEIHLATGFQNIVFESPRFPDEVKRAMNAYIMEHFADERNPGWSDEQFLYKLRKKGWGPYKKQLWDMPGVTIDAVCRELEDKFDFLFRKLKSVDTRDVVLEKVRPVRVSAPKPF